MNRNKFILFIIFLLCLHMAATSSFAERGRVRIINNNVVADNGWPLRGEAMFLTYADGSTTGEFTLYNLYDLAFWRILRDDFHLNTVRLFVMRPPQNWGGGPGDQCFPDDPAGYRCFDLDYVHYDPNDHASYPPPDTSKYTDLVLPNQTLTALDVIDDVVDIAAQMGMYLIIDYHPVLGHDEVDATQWWTAIAPRYKNRTHVIYELANEPLATPSFEFNIYTLIRNLAPNTHVIMWTFHNISLNMLGEVNSGNQLINANAYTNGSVGYHPYWNYNQNKDKILNL